MKKLLADLLLVLCASVVLAVGQESADPSFPGERGPRDDSMVLREVETLKGENVRLKLDSLDKQMRLMQEQYARLQEAQRALVGELQALDAEILKARGLPMQEHRVNWQEGKIEPATARTGVPAAPQEKKQ
jgi:hypothetical protein